MRVITLQEFHAEVLAQGVPLHQVAAVCPVCKTVQCPSDLIAAGAGKTFEEVEPFFGFSCVGRTVQTPQARSDHRRWRAPSSIRSGHS